MRRDVTGVFIVSLMLLLPVIDALNAQTNPYDPSYAPIKELRAKKINPHVPQIDGDLSDAIWNDEELPIGRDFRQMSPVEGAAASESTHVAVVYGDDALYIGFWCFETQPEKILAELVRRDRYSNSDNISVYLDPYHDHQSGYQFQMNAAGVLRDVQLSYDTDSDLSWDAVWNGATKIQPWGWSAEIEIPYSCIRFHESETEQTWGFNATRYISKADESTWWRFSPSTEGGWVSTFGHLHGIKGIKPATQLEVLPYSVVKLETEPKNNGNPDGRTSYADVGFDVKYSLASNMTLDATINPDFGQVELDQPVLNLTSFETYYSEKRPFFLEGANLFDTEFTMFYSRRIGRSPRIWPDDVDYYINRPYATTILGAGKITGKIAEKTSIAVLSAVTDEEVAEFVGTDGVTREDVVEPKASYNVIRVKQDFLQCSHIGFLGTLAALDKYHPEATAGIDWRLYTSKADYGFRGQVVTSDVGDDPPGFGLDVTFGKPAGRNFRGSFGIEMADPNLDLNGLGYNSVNNYREFWAWTQIKFDSKEYGIFRGIYNNFNYWSDWNYDGARISHGGNYNFSLGFVNSWYFSGGINFNSATWDPWENRGNGLWREPSDWSWWACIGTDSRKTIYLEINPGSGKSDYGTWWANYVGMVIRPRVNIDLSVGSNYKRRFGMTRWVENIEDPNTGEEISIFADHDLDQVTPEISISWSLTRDLSFQFSGEMHISGIDHFDYRRYIGNEGYAPVGDIKTQEDLESDHDYNYRAFNSTMVIRWEYNPGSTVYLVWTQSRSGLESHNDLRFHRDFEELFSSDTEGMNVFLIKASYWLNI